MILDSAEVPVVPASAPESGADLILWPAEAASVIRDPADRVSARMKLEDAAQALAEGEAILESFLTRSLGMATQSLNAGEVALNSVRESLAGRGERLADAGQRLVESVATKVADFAYGQLVQGFVLMGSANVPVAESSGAVAVVLAAEPGKSLDTISTYTPGGEAGDSSDLALPPLYSRPLGEADDGPTKGEPQDVQSVVAWAREEAERIRQDGKVPTIIRDVGDGANPLPSPIETTPEECMATPEAYAIIGNGAEYLPVPRTRPQGQFSPEADRFIVRLAQDSAKGLLGMYSFQFNNYDSNGNGYGEWRFADKPGGPLIVRVGASENAAPRPGDDPSYGFGLMGWPISAFPSAMSAECSTASPPPPPPPPDIFSPPPPPDAQCCPAPEPVVNEWNAKQPRPVQAGFSKTGLDWCQFINSMVDSPTFGGPPLEMPGESGPKAEPSYWAATWDATVKGTINPFSIMKIFEGVKSAPKGSPAEAMMQKLGLNQELAKAHAEDIEKASGIPKGKIAGLLSAYTLFGWAKTVTGWPTDYLGLPYEYALKYLIPRQIPGQTTIDELYLTSQIDDENWECYTRSLGNLPGIHRKARDVHETTPNIAEQVDLYMREKITLPQLSKELERYGVRKESDIFKWIELRNQIPQFADIIRFMVRDVVNEQVVKDGQFDSGFQDNFNGILKTWAQQQGITENVALAFWRAHWELPSPTMAYEMLRRLRPGRVDEGISTTVDQVKSLLNAADYAPGWRDRMIAISYLTPTRTDIKQGYSRNVYDRKEVIEMLQDTGLDAKGSESVAKLYDYEKEVAQRTINEKNSAWSVRSVLNEYIDGMMNNKEVEFVLKQFGISDKRIEAMLASANLKSVIKVRRSCSKAIERRYKLGVIDGKTAIKLLIDRSHEQDAAEQMVEDWECRRSADLQEIPARKNLTWAIDGVITIAEFTKRLQNLRYSNDDIERYVAEALLRIREAAAKAAEKQLRDAVGELRKRKAAYDKYVADLQKQIKELEKKKKELEKSGGG